MTKHEYLLTILNNLNKDFSDWVKIELRENYLEEDCFYFKMDNLNICISEKDFLFDGVCLDGVRVYATEEFALESVQKATKRVEDIVARLYVKRLFKEYGY